MNNDTRLEALTDTECLETSGGLIAVLGIIVALRDEIGEALAGLFNGLGGIDGCGGK